MMFEDQLVVRAIINTFILAIGGATLTLGLSVLISYVVVCTRLPGRGLIGFLALLPVSVPGIVFGVALMWGYIFLPLPIYGTMWMLLIAYISHYVTYGVRATTAGLMQIGPELEECSRLHGANWFRTMGLIVLPLLRQSLMVGWILLFAEFVRALSVSVLLYNSESIVLPVAIFELFETGAYPELAALSVAQTVLVFLAIYVARWIAKVDSFMDVRD
jgi:iron(III) transport system permease protein